MITVWKRSVGKSENRVESEVKGACCRPDGKDEFGGLPKEYIKTVS